MVAFCDTKNLGKYFLYINRTGSPTRLTNRLENTGGNLRSILVFFFVYRLKSIIYRCYSKNDETPRFKHVVLDVLFKNNSDIEDNVTKVLDFLYRHVFQKTVGIHVGTNNAQVLDDLFRILEIDGRGKLITKQYSKRDGFSFDIANFHL